LTYSEGIEMLRADGEEIEDYADMSYGPLVLLSDWIRTPQEKRLGKLIKEKYKTDFCILTKTQS
jgi:aspartyl-tRNA synthetase